MTAGRDATLDAVLTSTPKDAWQVIFEKLWVIFSAPVTAQHAEREVTERERKIGELELMLSGSAWELWRDFETSVPHTAQSLIEFWNNTPSGRAVLILDALSLREAPWLLQEAERRGYQLHQLARAAPKFRAILYLLRRRSGSASAHRSKITARGPPTT